MRNRRRKILLTLAAWLATAATIIGLALTINYVIQPKMQKETYGRTAYRYGAFVLWYPEESPQIEDRDRLHAQIAEIHDELVETLEISRERLPERVDIFIHDSIAELMDSVQRRKGIDTMHSKASLDLVPGMDLRSQIVEHLLAEGWGTCYSQLAYRGLVTYLSSPTQDFHAPVAALPESMRFSADTLLAWESGGLFPRTYYQKVLSPSSKRFILTLLDVANLIAIPETLAGMSEHDLPTLLAASLMQYVFHLDGGMHQLQAHWSGSVTKVLLEAAAEQPLAALVSDWYREARALASGSKERDLWEVRFSIQSGQYRRANQLASQWEDHELTDDRRELLLISTLLLGDVGSARECIDASPDSLMCGDLVAWTESLDQMNRTETDLIRIAGDLPEQELSRRAHELGKGLQRISMELEFEYSELELPLSVILYDSEEARDLGRSLTHSSVLSSPSLHLLVEEGDLPQLALSVCAFYWGTSRSALLRAGVAQLFSQEREELQHSACAQITASSWVPLRELMLRPVSDPAVDLEMGMFLLALLEEYGPQAVQEVWRRTTLGGGSFSLIGALHQQESFQLDAFEQEIEARFCPSV